MAWAVLCAYKGVVKVRQQGKNARENGYLFQIDTLAVTEQARRLAASGKLEAASIVLEDLLAGGKDAVNPRTVDLAARVRARTGDFEGARSLWEWLLEKEPENPNYKRAWARCKKAGRGSFHRFVACFPWQYAVASVLVVCIALGALSATLSRRGQSLPGRSDASIMQEIDAILSGDFGPQVTATVSDSLVVKMHGQVWSLWRKQELEALLAGLSDVVAVDLSDLTPVPSIVVAQGDTLWSLAEMYLGTGFQWPLLANKNNIPPPYLIKPGTFLLVPWDESGGEP